LLFGLIVISLHNVLLRLDRENNRAGACLFGLHLVELKKVAASKKNILKKLK
jgi:hypothetical protein